MLPLWNIVVITCFVILSCIGVTGNLLVLYVLRIMKPTGLRHNFRNIKITPMETAICYLACVDLMSSLCNPILYIYYEATQYNGWRLGEITCKILPSMNAVFDTMSFGIILVITIERCIVLCFPFKKNLQTNEIRMAVFVVFFISTVCEIPYMMNLHIYELATASYECKKNKSVSATRSYAPLFQEDREQGSLLSSSRSSWTNNDPDDLINEDQMIYGLCSSAQENFTSEKNFSAGDFQQKVFCQLKSCTQNWHTCIPLPSPFYNYSRVAMFFMRDILFIIIFVATIKFMYQNLKSHKTIFRKQSSIRPKKTLFMLVIIASAFLFLVLPRDIFHLIHTLSILTGNLIDGDISMKVNTSLKILQCSNSICNVFIYAKLHNKIRKRLRAISISLSDSIIKRATFKRKTSQPTSSFMIKTLETLEETIL